MFRSKTPEPGPLFLYLMLILKIYQIQASSMHFESSQYSSGQKNMQKTIEKTIKDCLGAI